MGIPTDFYPRHIRDSPAVIEIIVKYDTLHLLLGFGDSVQYCSENKKLVVL